MEFQLDQNYLEKYIEDPKVLERLTTYLNIHDTIGEEIFPYLGLDSNHFKVGKYIISNSKNLFLRRIPFYLHKHQHELKHLGQVKDYLVDLFQYPEYAGELEKNTEQVYEWFEKMHFHYQISVDDILNYPRIQLGTSSGIGDFLFKWGHYLELMDDLVLPDKMPAHFIVAYNEALERKGLPPIIYDLEMQYNNDYVSRNGQILKVRGTIPCDQSGQPILRWIGLQIKNELKVWAEVNKSFKGELFIQVGPKTAIWARNIYGPQVNGEDEFYPLFYGPLLMEFDNEALKFYRGNSGYTQKEIADAIGANVRTFQKWEHGETEPDSRFMLRLMNFLDIQDTKQLTRFLDYEDIK